MRDEVLVRFWGGEWGGRVEVEVVLEAAGCVAVLPGAHCAGEGGGFGHAPGPWCVD